MASLRVTIRALRYMLHTVVHYAFFEWEREGKGERGAIISSLYQPTQFYHLKVFTDQFPTNLLTSHIIFSNKITPQHPTWDAPGYICILVPIVVWIWLILKVCLNVWTKTGFLSNLQPSKQLKSGKVHLIWNPSNIRK